MSDGRREGLAVETAWMGGFRVDGVKDPAPGHKVGGDILLFHLADDALWFAIADMAGSGSTGHQAWSAIEANTLAAWERLISSAGEQVNLEAFGQEVNAAAIETATSLCMAAGRVTGGRIDWATWGYGVHVLPSRRGLPCPLPSYEQAFGLKLGWLSEREFNETPGSFVPRSFEHPSTVMLFTDGVLGDDHAAPARTWEWIAALNRDCAAMASDSIELLLDRADIQHDDVTVALITPNL